MRIRVISRTGRSFIFLGISGMLLGCSNNNYPLTISMASKPLVINTSFGYSITDTGGNIATKEVPSDWFKAFFHFQNDGKEQITIASLKVKVSVPKDSGLNSITANTSTTQVQETECELTPSTDSALQTQSPLYLVTLQAGEKTSGGTSFEKFDKDGSSIGSVTFSDGIGGYCSGLDFPEGLFSAYAEIEVNGWIGPPTNATGRLKLKRFSFNTE